MMRLGSFHGQRKNDKYTMSLEMQLITSLNDWRINTKFKSKILLKEIKESYDHDCFTFKFVGKETICHQTNVKYKLASYLRNLSLEDKKIEILFHSEILDLASQEYFQKIKRKYFLKNSGDSGDKLQIMRSDSFGREKKKRKKSFSGDGGEHDQEKNENEKKNFQSEKSSEGKKNESSSFNNINAKNLEHEIDMLSGNIDALKNPSIVENEAPSKQTNEENQKDDVDEGKKSVSSDLETDQFCCFYLENMKFDKPEEIIKMLAIEDFLKEVYHEKQQDEAKMLNFKIYKEIKNPKTKISFLDERFRTCIINIEEKSSSGLYDLFIAFLESKSEKIMKRFEEKETDSHIPTEREFHETRSQRRQRWRENPILRKYDNHYDSSGLHDFPTIEVFFKKLDIDQDKLISLSDLFQFKKKYDLTTPDEDVIKLIESANWHKKHLVLYPLHRHSSIREPLTLKDLANCLRYHKTYGDNGEVMERFRNTISIWEQFLDGAGIKNPPPPNDIVRIQHKMETLIDKGNFRTKKGESFTRNFFPSRHDNLEIFGQDTIVKEKEKILFKNRNKIEAGIVINTTCNIVEVDNEELNMKKAFIHDPIHQIVNSKIGNFDDHQKMPTVSFTAKQFFDEGERISKAPEEIEQGSIHPIIKYIPENEDIDPFENIPNEGSMVSDHFGKTSMSMFRTRRTRRGLRINRKTGSIRLKKEAKKMGKTLDTKLPSFGSKGFSSRGFRTKTALK